MKLLADVAQRHRSRRDGGERRLLRIVRLFRPHPRPARQEVQLRVEEEYRLPSLNNFVIFDTFSRH